MITGSAELIITFAAPPRVARRSRYRLGIRASDDALEAHGGMLMRCGPNGVFTIVPIAVARCQPHTRRLLFGAKTQQKRVSFTRGQSDVAGTERTID